MSNDWSGQQTKIFSYFEDGKGNLVIRARAGTGKTTTIREGVNRAPEAKILVCAFNKKIQMELAAKISNPRVEAKTLHALGYAFVRSAWGSVKPEDKVEAQRVKEVLPANTPDEVAGLVVKMVGKAKNIAPFATAQDLTKIAEDFDLTPSESLEREGWTTERINSYVLRAMTLAKTVNASRTISFDDMVWLPVVLKLIRPWYNMVVVDEAQDMNACQLLIAQGSCKRGGRIVVVGDDRQAIYGFRGADSKSIDRLKTELKAQELGLTITYRCPKTVVELAARLVPDYQAAETAPMGIVDTMDYNLIFDAARVTDFILSRKNAPLMAVCMGFLRRGIRARVEGREIGAGLVALVKKMKARSMVEFLTKLTRWKDREIERATARENQVLIDRVGDQYETLVTLADGLTGVPELESRIVSLFEDSDKNPLPAIVCSSVHKSKGLETERVFVLTDTLYPGRRRDIEEDNIAYVAYTRAKSHLTLVEGLAGKPKEASNG